MKPLEAARRSVNNRQAVKKAEVVGCYSCLAVSSSETVKEWDDDGETALCPHCGMDALLPNISNLKILEEAKKALFTEPERKAVSKAGEDNGHRTDDTAELPWRLSSLFS